MFANLLLFWRVGGRRRLKLDSDLAAFLIPSGVDPDRTAGFSPHDDDPFGVDPEGTASLAPGPDDDPFGVDPDLTQ